MRSSAPAAVPWRAEGGGGGGIAKNAEREGGRERQGEAQDAARETRPGGRDGRSAISAMRLETMMDERRQHTHNSHKLVLRAFLESDAREKGIADVIGVLKLSVGETPCAAHDSPLCDQTLVLAPDKRSEAVSAKAAMRASRSPSSRTFFIHAVEASNAQRWMIEVVLQIERNAQSALVKHYQVFNSNKQYITRCASSESSPRIDPPASPLYLASSAHPRDPLPGQE